MYWILAGIALVLIGFLLDREIYFYEGVHLGPRFQAWFYDRWATKYDDGKRESQLRDNEMLAQPLLEKLQDIPEPFVLDFATGTGRLSYALLNRPEFHGRILALDISQKMLEKAAEKVSHAERAGTDASAQVDFIRHLSMPLPFPDAAFDVVCCLEVLELLPDAQSALNEMSRLLRPGGILLTSRGTEESGRRAKVKSETEMRSMLQTSGFENIEIARWWKLFDRVLADKRGLSDPVGSKPLTDVLTCSTCGQVDWTRKPGTLLCNRCGRELAVAGMQIVLN